MKQPQNNLRAVIEKTEGHIHQPETEDVQPEPAPKSKRSPSREGKKVIMGFFSKAKHKKMRLLSIENEKSMETLLEEAVDLYLEMNNMSS